MNAKSKDVNERTCNDKNIEKFHKSYEILFYNSPDAIVYFDENHIVVDANDTFLRIFGYTLEECIGKNLDELVSIYDKKSEAEAKTVELFEKGKVEFEGVRYNKSGESIFVNARVVLMKIEDETIGGYCIYTDITEKENYRKNLEINNEELEATIQQLSIGEEELRAQ